MIKPADKGGAIVIMDKTNYLKEANRLLSDTNTYTPLEQDPLSRVTTKIHQLLDMYLDYKTIDKTTYQFLKTLHPITPVFYFLPKINKSLQNPPGRPIVLTPLIKNTKSYLRDTGHFLDIVQKQSTIPPNSLLVTLDVNSLYTSIQHDLGLAAVKTLLTDSIYTQDEITFCLDTLTIILKENYFLFGDQFYLQKCKTAMGSYVAPPYVNAYMAIFEETHIYTNKLYQQHSVLW